MLFWSLFLKTHKKTVINHQKWPKLCFWLSITFLYVLKKRTFVRLLFLKLNQSRNMKNNFLGWGFSSKKNLLFGGPKWYLLKSNFIFLFLRLFFNVKGSSLAIWQKNLGPLEFFKKGKLWGTHQNFGIGLLKSFLIFGYLTCSTFHPTVYPVQECPASFQWIIVLGWDIFCVF